MTMSKIFLMFPGQGSQYPGMGADWFQNFKEARDAFEEASDHSGLDLKKLCFEGSESDLKATEITQPAILTTSIAIFRSVCAHFGLAAKLGDVVVAGHSLGEYSALVAAGALDLGTAAKIVHHRGKFMQEAVPAGVGAMSALIFRPKTDATDLVPKICEVARGESKKFVGVANYNSPEQIVISGEVAAVNRAAEIALTEAYGARKAVPLPVSAPFHCTLMEPAAKKLAPELVGASWKTSPISYYANVDARLYSLNATSLNAVAGAGVADRLIQQITGSVLWTQTVRAVLKSETTRAFEIGPGSVLTGLARRIDLEGRSLDAKSIDKLEAFKNENSQF
jgi:[acyl-carrier-protein] S-malonyltransferase